LEVQQISGLEVDEEQRGPRPGHQIAESIEVSIAAVIRDGERVAVDPDESRRPAAVRD
jgi:hypothetical protein